MEAAFSIPGYNYFVDEYNSLCGGADSLDYLGASDELYSNEGHPENYRPYTPNDNLSKSSTVGNKEFLEDLPYIERESSNS